MIIPSAVRVDRELVRRHGLHRFIKLGWGQVEAARYVDNWHVEELSTHLEACQRREIRELLVNEPPGCMKSLSISVFYPAWCWIEDATEKFIYSTYDAGLSEKHARMMRDLVRSEWFQARWGAGTEHGIEIPMSHARKVREFENAHRGWRYSTSTGGPVTGRHGSQIIYDDPIKPKETEGGAEKTRVKLDAADAFWTNTLATRQADPTRTVKIMMMQRLHDDDPAGRELRRNPNAVHLMLPMRFESKRKCITKWGGDRRTEEGELLWPARFPEVEIAKLENTLGQHAYAQLQQDPVPPGGYFFDAAWLKNEWAILPPEQETTWIQSWDMRFKDSSTSGDYVVGQVWGLYRGLFFLVDQVRGRWSFTETCEQVVLLSAKWPRALTKLIEKKANGEAVVSSLSDSIPGFELVEPNGKESQAAAVTPVFKSGNVLVPKALWVADWRTELERFPKAPHDDQVDATTQAVLHLMLGASLFAAAMARLAADPGMARQLGLR